MEAARRIFAVSLVLLFMTILIAYSGCGGGTFTGTWTGGGGGGGTGSSIPTGSLTGGSGSKGSGGQTGDYETTIAGWSCKVFVPSSYNSSTPIPLMLGFHGAGQDGPNYEGGTGLGTFAKSNNFIFVICDYSGSVTWSPTDSAQESTAAQVLTWMEGKYNIDTKREYAHGFSQGGFFVVAWAFRSGKLAGFTENSSGATYQDSPYIPDPAYNKVAGVIFHCEDDSVCPASGSHNLQTAMDAKSLPNYPVFKASGGHSCQPFQSNLSAMWDFLKSHPHQ